MDWVGSEQTLDYNALYTVALAAAIDLPAAFWKSPCGGAHSQTSVNSFRSVVCVCVQQAQSAAGVSNDLMLNKKAGLARGTTKFPDSEVYIYEDFQEYGFTRTLPESWINEIP